MNEQEFRMALKSVPSLDEVNPGTIVARGQSIRRVRWAVGGIVGVAAVVGATIGGVMLWPGNAGAPNPILATPVASAPATPTPQPSPLPSPSSASTTKAPSAAPSKTASGGTAPGGDTPITARGQVAIKLPHEGVKAAGPDETDWTARPWFCKFCFTQPDAPSGKLVAAKVIEQTAGESTGREAALVFADAAAATAFVDTLTRDYAACDQRPASSTMRVRSAVGGASQGAFDRVVTAAFWIEEKAGSTWREAPGGGVLVFAQEGRVVLMSGASGEYVGNTLQKRPTEITPMVKSLATVERQACAVAGTC